MPLIRLKRMLAGAFALTVLAVDAQNIAWVGPTGITGDANLFTVGTYFDALMLNKSVGLAVSADGVTFNISTNMGGGQNS